MTTPPLPHSLLAGLCLVFAAQLHAIVPEHKVEDGAVRLAGVGPDNPILYDNDWWFDVFDNNYLWAQASLGQSNLRGNIVSRDMWDWQKGYHYSLNQSWQDAEKALKLARDSNLKRFIKMDLGRANQLGDGAPLVWLFQPNCWTGAEVHRAEFQGATMRYVPVPAGGTGDVLVIPKAATALPACREEFFRVLRDPMVYQGNDAAGAPTQQAGLAVTALGKHDKPDPPQVVIQQAHADPGAPSLVQYDLTPLQDAERALANPHKGWYHHYPDNHINKYEIGRDADLLEFTGMDHLYIRLAWAYLEPREGQFDWAVIDRIIEKWTAHGLGIAFRISCKETSTNRVEQQFATPRWVMEAGAQGGHYRMGQETGPEGPWEPVFDDPIFLAKLDRFLAAFAARYDHQPWLRYVDIGSIGDWGEGHSWAGSRKEVGFAARKQHVDLHLKHFKRAQLVVSDDFMFALNDAAERAALHRYVLTNGITYRDDSILVNGCLAGTSDRFTVRSPEFFADAYPNTPTVFELEHYGTVKRFGNWEGRPDSLVAKYGKGKNGQDYFRGALALLRATYIGYHGYAHEWLADNPEFTREMLNRCGYWLFPTSLALPEKAAAGATIPMTLTMANRGVAPPYQPYELRVKLSGAGTNWVRVMGQANKSWLPGTPVVCTCDLPLPAALPPGEYRVAIGLIDAARSKARPVEFALQAGLRDDGGYYRLATLKLTAP